MRRFIHFCFISEIWLKNPTCFAFIFDASSGYLFRVKSGVIILIVIKSISMLPKIQCNKKKSCIVRKEDSRRILLFLFAEFWFFCFKNELQIKTLIIYYICSHNYICENLIFRFWITWEAQSKDSAVKNFVSNVQVISLYFS